MSAIIETSLEEMREDDNWQEVFRHANGEATQQGECHTPDPVPGSVASSDHFGMDDVADILGSVEGDFDGDDWVVYGRLRDGRYFAIRAGCDYTGWD